jgi:hypothetical protein
MIDENAFNVAMQAVAGRENTLANFREAFEVYEVAKQQAPVPESFDLALANAAEILANFKGCEAHEDGTLERKLEEWQACYAKLFTQMNQLVQEMHILKSAPKPVSGWQPIETAPTDEAKSILVWCAGNRCTYVVTPELDGWMHFGGGFGRYLEHKPTHWQPIPEAPRLIEQEFGNE